MIQINKNARLHILRL